MTKRIGLIVAVLAGLAAGPARAQEPAALVEDVTSKSAGVEFMDYVVPGRVLKLAAADQLVLGYLRSCWRETITGGTVTIGLEQSEVAGGTVRRQKVQCDGGRMRLTQAQAQQSGAMVFRAPPTTVRPADQPQLTLYGLSPLVEFTSVAGPSSASTCSPGRSMRSNTILPPPLNSTSGDRP